MKNAANAKYRAAPIPAALADLAYVTGPELAAAGRMTYQHFLDQVACGNAPKPDVRMPRFSRWRVSTARSWLEKIAEAGTLEIGPAADASAQPATEPAAPQQPARGRRGRQSAKTEA